MPSTKKSWKNAVILVVFSLSALVSLAFLGISVWGDIEASMFDLKYKGDERLGTLSCPVMITTKDSGQVSAKISNPKNKSLKSNLRLMVSSSHVYMQRDEIIKYQLAPNESRKLAWTIDPVRDAAFGEMVMVKVYLYKNYPIASKDATCGILVLDLPAFSGKTILYSGIGFSFLGMVAGVGFWNRNNGLMTKKQRELYRAISILTVTLIVGLVTSILGYWLIGSIAIVVAVLLTAGTIFQML